MYKEILLDRALLVNQYGLIHCVQKILNYILEIVPEDFEASTRLALLKQEIAGSKAEQSYLEERLAENHDSTENAILLRLLAEINADAGDLDSAIENYDKALNLNPDDYRTYNGLGELCFSRGKIEEAFEFFKKAVNLHACSADVYNNLGVILSQGGESADAIKCFKKALSIMPTHPDAIKNMEVLSPIEQTPR